jgi:hypothetical protein
MSLQEIATTEHTPVVSATKPGKPPRISKRLAEAIRLVEDGTCATMKAVSERVNMNYTHLCEAFKKPHIQAFIARRRAENIARGTLRASARIGALVDASSEHVALHASRLLLETSGDLRSSAPGGVSVNIQNNVQAGYVIDLTPAVEHTKSPDLVSPDSKRNEP